MPRTRGPVSLAPIALLGAVLTTACAHGRRPASYLPVGARAAYGDGTSDGVVVSLSLAADVAASAAGAALRASGYTVASSDERRGLLRTAPRGLGGDTAMTVTTQVIAVERPGPAASVVLTATYDVPSRGIRGAPVLQPRGAASPLYGRLRAIADTLRRAHAP